MLTIYLAIYLLKSTFCCFKCSNNNIGVANAMFGTGFNYIIDGKYWIFSNNCNETSFRINLWPVGGAVIAPCIERNAEAVIRVISSATDSCLVGGRRNSIFTLDAEVDI